MSLSRYFRILNNRKVTRSFGLLEYFLAIQRAKIANKLIIQENKNGRVLDIGCGSYPIFLMTAKFNEKFAIDKIQHFASRVSKRLKLVNRDIENISNNFPFEDNSMDVITMLAVIEHIEYSKLMDILSEAHRILKAGGICIITVPSPWSEFILKMMSYLHIVSRIELQDHKTMLKNCKILEILRKAKFKNTRSGYFELCMNRWFVAKKL